MPYMWSRDEIKKKEIDNDNFASGKEVIIDGWNCECGICLDLYEN